MPDLTSPPPDAVDHEPEEQDDEPDDAADDAADDAGRLDAPELDADDV